MNRGKLKNVLQLFFRLLFFISAGTLSAQSHWQMQSPDPTELERDELVRNPFPKNSMKFGRSVLYGLADIQSEQITEIKGFAISMTNPHYLAPDQWAYSVVLEDKNAKDSVDFELKISNGSKTLRAYFPYAKRNSSYLSDPGNIEFYNTGQPGTLLFSRPYNYSIYQLTPDSATILYKKIHQVI